jgi:hypothetical protein
MIGLCQAIRTVGFATDRAVESRRRKSNGALAAAGEEMRRNAERER